jgi:hypothetical protein
MTQRDDPTTQDQAHDETTTGRKIDDRRGDVKPTDNPVPSSPEPDADAVRDGEEKLDRVKPY